MPISSVAAGQTERLLRSVPSVREANAPSVNAVALLQDRNPVAGRRLIARIAELNCDAKPVVAHARGHSGAVWSYALPNNFRIEGEVGGNRGLAFETANAVAGKRVNNIVAALTAWFGWHAVGRWFERTKSASHDDAMTAMPEAVLHVNFMRAVAITPRVRDLIISVGGQFAIVAPTNGGAFLGHLRLVSIGGRFHLCADLTTFLPDSQLSTGELSAAQDIRALALERSTPADLLAKRFMLAVEAANYDTVRDRRLDRLDAARLDADAPVEAALDEILASATTVVALYAARQLDPDQAAKMRAELPGLSG